MFDESDSHKSTVWFLSFFKKTIKPSVSVDPGKAAFNLCGCHQRFQATCAGNRFATKLQCRVADIPNCTPWPAHRGYRWSLHDQSHASAQCALASAAKAQPFAIGDLLNLKDRVLVLKNSSNLTGIFCLILAITPMRSAILLEFIWLSESWKDFYKFSKGSCNTLYQIDQSDYFDRFA